MQAQIRLGFHRKVRNAAVALIGLVVLCVMGIALVPVLVPRSPFGDDPFHYLDQPKLQPFYGWWNSFNRWQVSRSVLRDEAMQRALTTYTNKLFREQAFPTTFERGIQGISDKAQPKCKSLRFTNAVGAAGTISAAAFEKTTSPICQYYPFSAAFSENRNELAVEVKAYDDSLPSTLWIYTIEQSGNAKLSQKIEFASLIGPDAYMADGRLVYQPLLGQLGKAWDAKCALATDKAGQTSCLVPKAAFDKDKRIKAFHRPIGTKNMGIVLATRGRVEVDGYYFRQGAASLDFTKPSAINVEDFSLMKEGFLFSRNEPTGTRYHPVQRYYQQSDAHTPPALVLEVPFFKSSFVTDGVVAYVLQKSTTDQTYALTKITDSGVQDVPLGAGVRDATSIRLVKSQVAGLPTIGFRTADRSVYRGNVVPGHGFVPQDILTPSLPLMEYAYEAKSTDGTMVPCDFIAPKDAKFPIPAIAEVYGSYGSSLTVAQSPLIAAVLANQTGYLFAHARGGGERGREWHEVARGGLKKLKTVEDFEACVDEGSRMGYLAKGKVLVHGVSAGAIPALNTALRRPNMVAGAWLDVPYVDSSGRSGNSWGDDMEFGSFANPREAAERKQMSPYDNLLMPSDNSGRFLFTCGAHDTVVESWQCMKADAAIRSLHPNKHSEFVVLEDKDHFILDSNSDANLRNVQIILSFILKTLHPTP